LASIDPQQDQRLAQPKLAPPVKRVLAGLVDAALVAALTYFIVRRLGLRVVARPTRLAAISLLMMAVLPTAYAVLRDAFNGRSVGKALLGLQVFNTEKGKPAGLKESILRNALQGFVVVPVVGWLLWAGFGIVATIQLLTGRERRLGEGLCPEAVVVEEGSLGRRV